MPTNSVQIISEVTMDLTDKRGILVTSAGLVVTASTVLPLGPLEGNAELATTLGQQLFVTAHGFGVCIAGQDDLTAFGYVMSDDNGKVIDYALGEGGGDHIVGRYCPEPEDGVFVDVETNDEVRILINIHDATA